MRQGEKIKRHVRKDRSSMEGIQNKANVNVRQPVREKRDKENINGWSIRCVLME